MPEAKLEKTVKKIQEEALKAFASSNDTQTLYDLKVQYLGKQGEFSMVMREMGKMPKEERPIFGQLVNQIKQDLEKSYEARSDQLKAKELADQIKKETLDLTLPGPERLVGGVHPIHKVIYEIVDILARIGYAVRTGPLIEKDRYNFEALNIPENHPARDLQDTFYVNEDTVLRTHTSNVQIHTMENEKPPIRVLAPGSVFRCDSDVSHSPNFNQIEGLLIDKKVSMGDLKGTISYFVREFFGAGIKTRFRPSFFPFTEPSAEVDCSCPICRGNGCRMCKHTGWVEIGGSGLVNPKVLQFCGLDSEEWQGFAFGFGIERMAIIKYGIEDIRLFNENDLRFLRQFRL